MALESAGNGEKTNEHLPLDGSQFNPDQEGREAAKRKLADHQAGLSVAADEVEKAGAAGIIKGKELTDAMQSIRNEPDSQRLPLALQEKLINDLANNSLPEGAFDPFDMNSIAMGKRPDQLPENLEN
jgi:hypothetical protein